MTPPSSALGDANAYREIFFEETQEHLDNVEAILLRLEPGQACQDDLNAIFRAVHSIKGSAAMLGCHDMAAVAHLEENLLDLLRKDERPLERGDMDALLKAGDVIRAQALCHRGVSKAAPDSAPAEALLLVQLERPRTDAVAGYAGPVLRRFAVRLAPLAEPIPDAELDMMLTGLAEMGTVFATDLANQPGGHVAFQVELEGTAADLFNVLSLLVAPELVAIEKLGEPLAGLVQSPKPTVDIGDELFVDPAEFRRKRKGAPRAATLRAAEPQAELTESKAVEPLGLTVQDMGYIRVATEKIDLLVNLVGELVITEAMLARSRQVDGFEDGAVEADGELADLARHTRNLQRAVMAIRMLPMSNVFSRFTRLVRELAARLDKQVDLRVLGEAIELDRGLIEKISDPLTHLVRNAIDHGLESPAERLACGKPASGTLRLVARQRGGSVLIEVSDDGRGLDRERILAAATRRGIHVPADLPDNQVWPLIFEPGLSTAQQVTDLSGRGVGMDVVKRNIEAMSGLIELFSNPGEGTTVRVSVPLTLAIVDAMIVGVGSDAYVLPLAVVAESLRVERGQIHSLPGQSDMLRVRDDYLPVQYMARVFPPQQPAAVPAGIAVIVEADGAYAALMVDELIGQQQVVVKSLETNYRKVPGLSGATVMGDGSVALILDVSHLVRLCAQPTALTH